MTSLVMGERFLANPERSHLRPSPSQAPDWLANVLRQTARLRQHWQRPAELRIDVELPTEAVDNDLRRLDRRLRTPGDALHRCDAVCSPRPGLVLRHREADGEHYVYVQDTAQGCLAGYTVFNRLIELDRRADRVLRGPHSRFAPAYQRRGLARVVYEWALGAGLCFISGPRQSPGAHALWRSLAREHPIGFVSLRDKHLQWLGTEVDSATLEDFHTRMVMFGAGWDLPRFLAESGCTGAGSGGTALP